LVAASEKDGLQKFEVPLRLLHNILRERRVERVRLLKIDVEGWESRVINGIEDRLPDISHFIIELLDAGSDASDNTIAIIEKLQVAGFHLRTVTGALWDGRSPLPENNLLATHRNVEFSAEKAG
jgi:hypothetical protein